MNTIPLSHSSITAHVAGEPKGQPRPRAFVRGKRAAVYDPGTAEGWKSAVAAKFRKAEGLGLAGPLSVSLLFAFRRPKSHFRRNGELKPGAPEYHTAKPDADNLAKAVLDCLVAIRVIDDDAPVCVLHVTKRWAAPGCPAGCQVTIQRYQEDER